MANLAGSLKFEYLCFAPNQMCTDIPVEPKGREVAVQVEDL